MRQIAPYPLWLGHAGDGRDTHLILDTGLAAVVQLAVEEPTLQLPRELVYCRFPVLDGASNDLKILDLAMTTIANLLEKNIPLLVCCDSGTSRSPALAAAALALVYQENPDRCLEQILEHHPADVVPGLWNDVRSAFAAQRG
jgi:protein-tyrosine phosphatase